MAGKKIKALKSKAVPESTDVLIIEDDEATKRITLENLLKAAPEYGPRELVDATTSYAQSISGKVTPSTWSDAMPAPIQGEFLWVRLTFAYSDASEESKYVVVRHGADGKIDGDAIILFTEATTRENIASGDGMSRILGKIMKFFADFEVLEKEVEEIKETAITLETQIPFDDGEDE